MEFFVPELNKWLNSIITLTPLHLQLRSVVESFYSDQETSADGPIRKFLHIKFHPFNRQIENLDLILCQRCFLVFKFMIFSSLNDDETTLGSDLWSCGDG